MKTSAISDYLDGPCVIILIEPDREKPAAIRLRRIADEYKLTPAERRVAEGIVGGLSVEGVALAHGVSAETVKTQLKSIYAKMGISGQKELLRCLF